MMKNLLLLLGMFIVSAAFSQLPIGHTTITFTDPARSNRAIQTEIYYPATVAGDNKPVAVGLFPVVNFGHGFLMPWSAYQNIWEALVPEGYIVCLPRTEGNIFPNHEEFAKDLAFLVTAMKTQHTTVGSLFKGRVRYKFAIAGHSMGGGCAVVSHQYNTSINAIAVLAPAETTPSAKAAAKTYTKPALVFAGSLDCVTPPAQHAKPIYDSLASACKSYINLTGASHCQFALANTNCSLGEFSCTSPTITRAQQHALVNGLLKPWLDYQLKTDCVDWGAFQSLVTASSGFTYVQNCPGNVTCLKPKTPMTSNITANSAALNWVANLCPGQYDVQWRPSTTAVWTTVSNVNSNSFLLSGLLPAKTYKWRVRSRCNPAGVGISNYSAIITFTTPSSLLDEVPARDAIDWSAAPTFALYPNPAKDVLVFEMENQPNVQETQLTVVDMLGKTVWAQTISVDAAATAVQIPVANLSVGIYWIRADWGNGQITEKFVKE